MLFLFLFITLYLAGVYRKFLRLANILHEVCLFYSWYRNKCIITYSCLCFTMKVMMLLSIALRDFSCFSVQTHILKQIRIDYHLYRLEIYVSLLDYKPRIYDCWKTNSYNPQWTAKNQNIIRSNATIYLHRGCTSPTINLPNINIGRNPIFVRPFQRASFSPIILINVPKSAHYQTLSASLRPYFTERVTRFLIPFTLLMFYTYSSPRSGGTFARFTAVVGDAPGDSAPGKHEPSTLFIRRSFLFSVSGCPLSQPSPPAPSPSVSMAPVTCLIFHIVASPGFVTSDRFSALAHFRQR